MENKKIIFIIVSAIILFIIIGLTIFFVVQPKYYTVTFNSDGGTSIESQKVKKNENVKKPENPSKENYEFIAWYLDNEEYDFSKKVTKDITLIAKWSEKTTLDEELNTVSLEHENLTLTVGETSTLKVEYQGKEELVWSSDNKKVATVNNKGVVKAIAAGKATIKVTIAGETKATCVITVKEKKTTSQNNTQTKPTTPTKPETPTTPTKPETSKQYKVIFDSNGGSSNPNAQTVNEGEKVNKPSDPIREGYIFVAWQLNGQNYDFNKSVNSDITLIAKWEKKADIYTAKLVPYSSQTPEIGTIQIFKNGGTTPIGFTELQNSSGGYIGKYNAEDKGMRNANQLVLNNLAKVKLLDGTVVNIQK